MIDKILFIHKPKTAGTSLTNIMERDPIKYISAYNQTTNRMTEFTDEEMLKWATVDFTERVCLHRHLPMTEQVFNCYKTNGWFSFVFLRNIPDVICSMYFFLKYCEEGPFPWMETLDHLVEPIRWTKSVTLDHYITTVINNQKPNDWWSTPTFIEQIDWVGKMNHHSMQELCSIIGVKFKNYTANVSRNKGYQFYRDAGDISDETHDLIMNHPEVKRTEAILSEI